MVNITGNRNNSGVDYPNKPQVVEIYRALQKLAIYELGYGGRITSVNTVAGNIVITVVTRIMNCIDTTVFSGTQEEMSLLLEFLGYYAEVEKVRDMGRLSQAVIDALGGRMPTLVLVNWGPILIGMSEMFSVLVAFAGLKTQEQVRLAREMVSFNTRTPGRDGYYQNGLVTLLEVIEYVRELGVSFEDACQQIGGVQLEAVVL